MVDPSPTSSRHPPPTAHDVEVLKGLVPAPKAEFKYRELFSLYRDGQMRLHPEIINDLLIGTTPSEVLVGKVQRSASFFSVTRSRLGRGTCSSLGLSVPTQSPKGILTTVLGVPGELRWFSAAALQAAGNDSAPVPGLQKQFAILPGTHRFSADGTRLYAPGQHGHYGTVQRIQLNLSDQFQPLTAEYLWVFRTGGIPHATCFTGDNALLVAALPDVESTPSAIKSRLAAFRLDAAARSPEAIHCSSSTAKIVALCGGRHYREIVGVSLNNELLLWEIVTEAIHLSGQFPLPACPTCLALRRSDGAIMVGCADGQILLSYPKHDSAQPLYKTEHAILSLALSPDGSYLAASDTNGGVHVLTQSTGRH